MSHVDLAVPGLLGSVALVGLGVWAMTPSGAHLAWRQLHLPAELRREQVEALLRAVAAGRGPVVFAIDARDQAISFRLGALVGRLGELASALAGIIPEAQTEAGAALAAGRSGMRAWWPGRWPLLRTEAPELTVAALLGALSAVGAGEHVQLLVRLQPAGGVPTPEGNVGSQLRGKLSGGVLRAELLVSVTATSPARTRQLLQSVAASLRVLDGPGARLRLRRLGSGRAMRRAVTGATAVQQWWWRPSTLLSPAELVAIVGLPIGAPRLPGISYGAAPRLLAPRDLAPASTTVRTFARSNAAASQGVALTQPLAGGLQHVGVIGPTGSGKSSLLVNLIEQDLRAGRGALVLDAKGDLVGEVLERIPARRAGDVVLLDPASDRPQPGLKLFSPGADPELTSELLLGTLSALYADSWGIRTSSYLRLGLMTLSHFRGASLPMLPALFTDRSFRQRVLGGVDDRLLLAAWQRFEALSAADQAAQLAPALRKIEELVGRRRLRVVLGQSSPKLHFGEVLARGRVVLVRLPPGLLGAAAAELLSALVLWQFFSAVEARAALPPAKRRPFFAYIDEPAALGSLPLPLDGLLERARGLGVGVTLAPQHLGQLKGSLRSALLANVGSLVAFGLAADEATTVARELSGVSAKQLQHLGRFEVAVRLAQGPGALRPTMTGRTEPISQACSDPAAITEAAARRYGSSLDQVDRALAGALGLADATDGTNGDEGADGPIGARRRTP